MNTSKPVYIHGCGIINALGHDQNSVRNNLLNGYLQGVHPWDKKINGKDVYVGQIDYELPSVPTHLQIFDCRNNQLILAVLSQLQAEVDALFSWAAKSRIAIILGSSTSGILEGEDALIYRHSSGNYPAHFHYRQQEIGTCAIFLREFLGLTGPAMTVSTACSSSAKVFATAQRMMQAGLCDAAIVGGADSLCQLTVNGFSALESVSAGRCNPMSLNRDGINIGEAAALYVLRREESDITLLGVGESSDAHHMSAPEPGGSGAIAAMRAALQSAGLDAAQISYINLHGTATPLNDAMESIAVSTVFGSGVPCSSTKPMTGHTLGAAGATEVGICYLCLTTGQQSSPLPVHVWDGQPDPSIPSLNLVKPGMTIPVTSGTAFLSNSFAFGGNNASVIIGRT
jgi:3-oxoacyl-[acyl-carrier-protein] synthase-1